MSDFLRECMESMGNPPIDLLQREWCVRCAERGCARSGLNNSAFDQRVKGWKERLFLNVPRADPSDPSYSNMRARSFSPGGQSPGEPQRTVVSVPGVPVATMPRPSGFVEKTEANTGEEIDLPILPDEEEVKTMGAPPPPEPSISTLPGLPELLAANTPFQQGMVIGGGERPREAEGDPTAAERRPQNDEPVQGVTFVLEDD